ncbi:unnamed protein product [marine sediment metagenome]|uniref:Uncharacterized protein n=1 Tax=marine sediment metagenome TaxID=412755 RepID=X1D6H0_9ZZZZ
MKNKERIAGLVIVIVASVTFVGSIIRFSLMERLPIKKGEAIQEEVVEEQAKITN